MKIDNKTLNNMQRDIKIIIPLLGLDIKTMNVNDMNNAWFYTWVNRTYEDNHPMIKKDFEGRRVLSFIDRENYDLYPCETNDTTIYTALNKILKNLQNE